MKEGFAPKGQTYNLQVTMICWNIEKRDSQRDLMQICFFSEKPVLEGVQLVADL